MRCEGRRPASRRLRVPGADDPADIARFRDAVRPEADPEEWFAAQVDAPLVIVAHSNKDAYLDRYALPDKGFTDRSVAWWTAPYWDIDTGFASLLMMLTAVDEGLGACFFGLPVDRIDSYRYAFGVPAHFARSGRSPSATATSRRKIRARLAGAADRWRT